MPRGLFLPRPRGPFSDSNMNHIEIRGRRYPMKTFDELTGRELLALLKVWERSAAKDASLDELTNLTRDSIRVLAPLATKHLNASAWTIPELWYLTQQVMEHVAAIAH